MNRQSRMNKITFGMCIYGAGIVLVAYNIAWPMLVGGFVLTVVGSILAIVKGSE